MNSPNVVVVLSRCSTSSRQTFGIRLEEVQPRSWSVTWAFPVKESAAGREGYDRSAISGNFGIDDAYPGCTSCSAKSIVLCNACGKIGCWNPANSVFTCPWCGSQGRVEGAITTLTPDRDI